MTRPIGQKKIEMYIDLIEQEFKPIVDELELRETFLKEQMHEEAIKEFGLDKLKKEFHILEAKEKALEEQRKEIKRKLIKITGGHYYNNDFNIMEYGINSSMDTMIKHKMSKTNGRILPKIITERDKLVKNIKLADVTNESIKDVFDAIPTMLTKFMHEIKKLPKPSIKPQIAA